ncbi:MAG: hypothetical protein ACK5IR_08670, partial [Tropicimonas sp.]
ARAGEEREVALAALAEVESRRTGASAESAELETLSATLAARRGEVAAAEERLEELAAAIAATPSATAPPAENTAIPAAASAEAPAPATMAERDPGRAVAMLSNAPGLAGVTPERIETLAAQLDNGTCAADAMRNALGEINRQTLLYLVRIYGPC